MRYILQEDEGHFIRMCLMAMHCIVATECAIFFKRTKVISLGCVSLLFTGLSLQNVQRSEGG